MADLARGETAFAHLSLERKSVAEVAAIGDDAGDDGAFAFAGKQRINQIDLVHCDELQDFTAHLAGSAARQFLDHLQMLGGPGRRV